MKFKFPAKDISQSEPEEEPGGVGGRRLPTEADAERAIACAAATAAADKPPVPEFSKAAKVTFFAVLFVRRLFFAFFVPLWESVPPLSKSELEPPPPPFAWESSEREFDEELETREETKDAAEAFC